MHWLRSSLLLGIGAIAVLGGLLASGVLAAPDSTPEKSTQVTVPRTLNGTVSAYQATTSLDVQVTNSHGVGHTLTIQLNPHTRILATASISGEPLVLQVGNQVTVQVTRNGNDTGWIATMIMVRPSNQEIQSIQQRQLEQVPDAISGMPSPTN